MRKSYQPSRGRIVLPFAERDLGGLLIWKYNPKPNHLGVPTAISERHRAMIETPRMSADIFASLKIRWVEVAGS